MNHPTGGPPQSPRMGCTAINFNGGLDNQQLAKVGVVTNSLGIRRRAGHLVTLYHRLQ
jgi:hypothetical protein